MQNDYRKEALHCLICCRRTTLNQCTMNHLIVEKLAALPCCRDLSNLRKLLTIAKLKIEAEISTLHRREQSSIDTPEQIRDILKAMPLSADPDVFQHFKLRAVETIELFVKQLDELKKATHKGRQVINAPFENRKIRLLNELEFALLQIEQDYGEFFSTNIPHLNYHLSDRIFNHVWFFATRDKIGMRIHSDSNLPENIREAIIKAFSDIQRKHHD